MRALSEILQPDEVSEILNIHLRQVYRLVKSGELRGFRIGRLIRVRRADLEEYLNERLSIGPAR